MLASGPQRYYPGLKHERQRKTKMEPKYHFKDNIFCNMISSWVTADVGLNIQIKRECIWFDIFSFLC